MTRYEIRFKFLFSIVTLGAASMVFADSAPPPPEDLDCPVGAVPVVPEVDPEALDPRGRPIQAWPFCGPSICASDADCDGGRTCSAEEIGLCVEDHEVAGGETGRSVRDRGCEPDDTCLNINSTCERARRCVTADAAPAEPSAEPAEDPEPEEGSKEADPATDLAPTSDAGCGCRISHASSSSALIGALLLGALLLRRRRR